MAREEVAKMREGASPEVYSKMLRGEILTVAEVGQVVERVSGMNDCDFKILSAQTAVVTLNLLNKNIAATEAFEASSTMLAGQVIHAVKDFDRSSSTLTNRVITLTRVLVFLTLSLVALTVALIVFEAQGADRQLRLLSRNVQVAEGQTSRLDSLIQRQQENIGTMQSANDLLQKSLKTTASMNTLLQRQLNIQAGEQERQLAELARRPNVRFFLGEAELQGKNLPRMPEFGVTVGDTAASLDLTVRNDGTAPARLVTVRVSIPDSSLTRTVQLACECKYEQYFFPANVGDAGPAIEIPLDTLAEGTWRTIRITMKYPKGTNFPVRIDLEAQGLGTRFMSSLVVKR
jgi:hypothetical protein